MLHEITVNDIIDQSISILPNYSSKHVRNINTKVLSARSLCQHEQDNTLPFLFQLLLYSVPATVGVRKVTVAILSHPLRMKKKSHSWLAVKPSTCVDFREKHCQLLGLFLCCQNKSLSSAISSLQLWISNYSDSTAH